MALPTDPKARKAIPVYSGFVAYFPRTMCAVAELSMLANEQHNPGQPLHWAKEKSTDEKDALMRHLVDPLTNGGDPYDLDRVLHATKKAWRACADLERLLETGIPTLRPDPIVPSYVFRDPGHNADTSKLMLRAEGARSLGASPYCYYCGELSGVDAPKSCPCPNNHIVVQSFKQYDLPGVGIVDEHRPPSICSDCGVDLEEGVHAPTCLRLNRQHF